MAYVVAAYSITIGALGLYWVLVVHRRRELIDELVGADSGTSTDLQAAFNVGAFLLAPLWMIRHGMLVPGIILLIPCLGLIPLHLRGMGTLVLFVAMVPLAAGLALGFVGNRIAIAHAGETEAAAFSASQLPWALFGVGLHAIALPWLFYFLIF